MKKPAKICGPPCKKLKKRQIPAHFEFLKHEAGEGHTTAGKAYKAAGYRPNSRKAAEAAASKLLNSDRMQQALQWHRDQVSKAVEVTVGDVIQGLLRIARTGDVRAADFVTVEHGRVKIRDWGEGDGQVSAELTRGVKVAETASGLKVTPPPIGVARQAWKDLADLLGFSPEKLRPGVDVEIKKGDDEIRVTVYEKPLET